MATAPLGRNVSDGFGGTLWADPRSGSRETDREKKILPYFSYFYHYYYLHLQQLPSSMLSVLLFTTSNNVYFRNNHYFHLPWAVSFIFIKMSTVINNSVIYMKLEPNKCLKQQQDTISLPECKMYSSLILIHSWCQSVFLVVCTCRFL